MTAALAAIGRAAVRFALAAVLVMVCVAAMLWAKFGPQGAWTLAWIVVVFATIWGAVEAWERLGKRRGRSTR